MALTRSAPDLPYKVSSWSKTNCCSRRTAVSRSTQAGPRLHGFAGALATVAAIGLPPAAARAAEAADDHRNYVLADVSTVGPTALDINADDGYEERASCWVAPGLGATYRYRPTRHLTLGVGLAGETLLAHSATPTTYPWHARAEVSAGVLVPMGEAWQLDLATGPGFIVVGYDSFFRGTGPSLALRSDVTRWIKRDVGVTASWVLLGAVAGNRHHEGDHAFNRSTAFLLSSQLHVGISWRG
jgi:hypothetical protein